MFLRIPPTPLFLTSHRSLISQAESQIVYHISVFISGARSPASAVSTTFMLDLSYDIEHHRKLVNEKRRFLLFC